MLTRELIEQLETFDGGGARVLSVYLDIAPDRQARHAYRVYLEDLAKDLRDQLEERLRREFSSEVGNVQEWLESERPRGKGLAVFSCRARGLWQTHRMPVPVEDHLVFEPKPDVAPLLDAVDEYERYAVALVDKENVRLFTVCQREIEESDAFKDFVPAKTDQGGLSQSNFQRHHEAHVYRHLKRVVQHLIEIHRRRSFDRLIVAGPEEATSELVGLLPRALARRVVAVIPGEMSWDQGQVLEKTLEVERQAEREVEERLLAELLETAGSRGKATRGLKATLEALWHGAVQKLVVAGGVHLAGSECPSCGRLEPGKLTACPTCAATMNTVHDVLHRAMGKTLEEAGSVEVLHGDAARRLVEEGQALGALLRYRW